MSARDLPERPSLEFLKKLAKERLASLRAGDPGVKLRGAQLAVAREFGFTSWRALVQEVDRRRAPLVAQFFAACAAGDVERLADVLRQDRSLVGARTDGGSTALHVAVAHPPALRLLLEHGADPNARDIADNATPLHFAAAGGNLDAVRLLLDAGADVHGSGDLHKAGVIGWAARPGNEAIVALLLERGARHHIFSAIAFRDLALVERLVEEDPSCLSRRRSRFEDEQTPLHAAFAPPDGLGFLAGRPDYGMMQLLLELGANLEARDSKGRTPLALALLRGDEQAIQLLRAAGAAEPTEPTGPVNEAPDPARIKKSVPMFLVRNMRATVQWYESLGFTVEDRYEHGGELTFARLSFGAGEFAFSPGGELGPRDVNLWFFTDGVHQLYGHFRQKQTQLLEDLGRLRFEQDLHQPFFGGHLFSIRDVNGLELLFWQPDWLSSAT